VHHRGRTGVLPRHQRQCRPVGRATAKERTGATAENRVFSVLQEADRLGSGPKNVFARVCVRGGDWLKQGAKAVPLFGLKPLLQCCRGSMKQRGARLRRTNVLAGGSTGPFPNVRTKSAQRCTFVRGGDRCAVTSSRGDAPPPSKVLQRTM